ncbi:BC1872 family protein [Neobacillus niacini]|uniref:BC1872 family protein n=1 Tax=Neobacillus niacini TaxID=86668 RepID=UPI0028553D3D|nr:hypothetical protein [Neobacillus niacini]MDR7000126.1 hypothetical protein [Neobacillus niacini]
MNKIEIIARRILGWKLNRWDRWYDEEKGIFIYAFQPEENLDHALLIVERMEKLGFSYEAKGAYKVCFNDVWATGNTLAQAITTAAYEIADNSSVPDEWL